MAAETAKEARTVRDANLSPRRKRAWEIDTWREHDVVRMRDLSRQQSERRQSAAHASFARRPPLMYADDGGAGMPRRPSTLAPGGGGAAVMSGAAQAGQADERQKRWR